ILARRNEIVTVPFAEVRLRGEGLICADFPRPLRPWPQISSPLAIDQVRIPRGWEYSVGYWVDGRSHHATILQSSRAVRSLAFLGEDDELVIAAPVSGRDFNWGTPDGPTATLEASISWRTRPDGTRG